MDVGRTGKVSRNPAVSEKTVTVGRETRGPEWGIGKAKREFDRMRSEYSKVPNGKHTEAELIEVLSAWRARNNGNGS